MRRTIDLIRPDGMLVVTYQFESSEDEIRNPLYEEMVPVAARETAISDGLVTVQEADDLTARVWRYWVQ